MKPTTNFKTDCTVYRMSLIIIVYVGGDH